jgi:hypothetical protein
MEPHGTARGSALPYYLEYQLRDGGEVGLTLRLGASQPLDNPWHMFVVEAIRSQCHNGVEMSRSVNKASVVSFAMIRRVALVRTGISEELSVTFVRVTRIGELGTTLAVTSNRRTLRPWMLPRVVIVRTDVSEDVSVSFIRVTRIGEL